MPTDKLLKLKLGAQIMTVKNGDDYVNGSIGIVKKLERDKIFVIFRILNIL